jgi:hypothetical protein
VRADEIPVAHTPPGGYGDVMPAPVLAGCDEPLVAGAPDLRGLWRVVEVEWKLGDPPDPIPVADHVERIEQAGDRICVTAGGVVHDMRADGTEANGVHDVASADGRQIHVVATYEDGVHVLRPIGMPDVEVTRRLDGDTLVWSYGPLFTARLARQRE